MSVESSNSQTKVKEPRRAIEMAHSIGSSVEEPDGNWLALSTSDLGSWLNSLGESFGFNWTEWSTMLIQAGLSLEKGVDQLILNLQGSAVELATAEQLRQDFGQPQAPVPMILEVYTELAIMEARARQELQSQAASIEKWWEGLQETIVKTIALALAAELNRLEDDEKAYKITLKNSIKKTETHANLQSAQEYVADSVDAKLNKIGDQKENLLVILKNFGYRAFDSVNKAFETTVFSASRMSLQISTIN